ncbi:MAG: hypothetical protein KKG59_05555 [Nanoarchaeota archaeon]|nr:hypothetical protein [Nanoarchaeota archaeon]
MKAQYETSNFGWILFIILILIGTLAYFGLLDPRIFLPSSCKVQAGFGCFEFKATKDTRELTLRNGIGQNIEDVIVTLEGEGTINCSKDFSGLSSSKWQMNNPICSETRCEFKSIPDVVLQNRKDIGHFRLVNCSNAVRRTDMDIIIEYRYKNEQVSHTTRGKAQLRVS